MSDEVIIRSDPESVYVTPASEVEAKPDARVGEVHEVHLHVGGVNGTGVHLGPREARIVAYALLRAAPGANGEEVPPPA